jgi:hypothetical protein
MNRKEKSLYFDKIADKIIKGIRISDTDNKGNPTMNSYIYYPWADWWGAAIFDKDFNPIVMPGDRSGFIRYVKKKYDNKLTPNDYLNIWKRFKKMVAVFREELTDKMIEIRDRHFKFLEHISNHIINRIEMSDYGMRLDDIQLSFQTQYQLEKTRGFKDWVTLNYALDDNMFALLVSTLQPKLYHMWRYEHPKWGHKYRHELNESISKTERYYNYIVDDLVKDTIFDQYDEDGNTYITKGYFDGNLKGAYIKMPYDTPLDWYRVDRGLPQPLLNSSIHDIGFVEHLKSKYGARESEDIWPVWDMYRERIIDILGINDV